MNYLEAFILICGPIILLLIVFNIGYIIGQSCAYKTLEFQNRLWRDAHK